MELRQRRAQPGEGGSSGGGGTFVETIKALDVYPKTHDDFKERTGSGAAVSIVSLSVIFLLVVSELRAYFTPVTTDHLYVDTTRGERIRINANITFPHMPCAGLNLVAMDVAGEQQIDVVRNLIKTRLSLDGHDLGKEVDGETMARKLKCGTCYSREQPPPRGERPNQRCCNSCADVKELYTELNQAAAKERQKEGAGGANADPRHAPTPSSYKWEEHTLCQHEAVLMDPSRLAKIHEGCNLFGFLEVNKVAGNFHVAPGKAFQSAAGQLVHEFKPFDTHTYNVSHTIHSLSFGVHYPSRVNPLDGATAILQNGSGVFQYFVKVVPTTYEPARGPKIHTHQYSVTDQFKSAHDPTKGFVLPGVFFIYDISPIMVKFTEKRTSFTHFLVSLCAIVGGVFTVSGIIDSVIYSTGGAIMRGGGKKSELSY